MDTIRRSIRSLVPTPLFRLLQPGYHYLLAFLGALLYGFPSRKLTVIGVTGTKGKSSTLEYLNTIFEEAGHTTALISTIRIKVAGSSRPNTARMTMPGRLFLNQTLSRAVLSGCDVAFVEMTSEGAKQHRHRFIAMDALIFTNLSPEHIESHGSFEKYARAKLSIARALGKSPKRPRYVVANADDPFGVQFLDTPVEHQLPYSLSQVDSYQATDQDGWFSYLGMRMHINQPGEFSIANALAATTLAYAMGIKLPTIQAGLERLTIIPGRAEAIDRGQDFLAVVDYAHTPDSLKALYDTYAGHRRVCVLGATGGTRDHWKRPEMGAIAEANCDHVILTNEDPYDEDPAHIIADIADGMRQKPDIIINRREAIRKAFSMARPGDAVLITGKGTDPCICGPNGSREPWSDAAVVIEELESLRGTS